MYVYGCFKHIFSCLRLNFYSPNLLPKITLQNLLPKFTRMWVNLFPKFTRMWVNLLPKCTRMRVNLLPKFTRMWVNLLPKFTRMRVNLLPKFTRMWVNLLPKFTRMWVNLLPKIYSHANTFLRVNFVRVILYSHFSANFVLRVILFASDLSGSRPQLFCTVGVIPMNRVTVRL